MKDISKIVSDIVKLGYDSGRVSNKSDWWDVSNIEEQAEHLKLNLDEYSGLAIDMEHVIGASIISLIYICERNNKSLEACLDKAYKLKKVGL
jgi:hypothetical protein